MMHFDRKRREAGDTTFLYGMVGAAALAVVLGAPAALAQEEPAEAEAVEEVVENASEAAEEPESDQLVITGSRLRRDSFSTAAPVSIINTENSSLAGLLTTADILQSSPLASGTQIDSSFSGFVIDGGIGAETVALRGLGANRTLVLVNGRRWVDGGIGGAVNSVDLSSVPTSLLDRVEILKDGASSIYGSDAISGVVNNILKNDFDGLQINGSVELTQSLEGGETYLMDVSYGKVFDNANFVIAGGYSHTPELIQSDRDWADCDTRPRLDGENIDPTTGEELCFGFIYGLAAFTPFGFLRYEPSLTDPSDTTNPYFSDPQAFGIPFFTTQPVGLENALNNDGAFYRDLESYDVATMVPEQDVYAVTSFGDYNFDMLGRGQTAYYEFFFNRRETENSGGYRQYFPTVPATSVYNPFGTSGPLAAFGGFSVAPVVPTYFLDPTFDLERTIYQGFAGIEGDISRTWKYDMNVGFGQNRAKSSYTNVLDAETNAAINAVVDPATGEIVCADALSADPQFPDCVPLNLFTEDALVNGQIPADALAFITDTIDGETVVEQFQFNFFADGDLVALPAGKAVGGVGVSYRRDRLNAVPDEQEIADNLWGFTTEGITRGTDSVWEVFGEVEVPLLKDMPMVKQLTVNAASRYSDYESPYSGTTYRVAGIYDMTDEIRFRSTFGTSFRAPGTDELFRGNTSGFAQGFLDPCINLDVNRDSDGDGVADADDIIVQNCLAQGLPTDLGATGAPSIRRIVGGADDLDAEESESFTYGVVYQPDWIGVSIAVDTFDIEITGSIIDPSAAFLLGACYSSPDLSSPFCNRIGPRDEFGFITDIDARFINVASETSKGFDINGRYEQSFPIGELAMEAEFTYLAERKVDILGDVTSFVQDYSFPRWSGDITSTFDYEDWRFLWQVDYIGPSEPATPGANRFVRTERHIEHSFGVRYSAADWVVSGTVRNAFDETPPLISDGSGTLTGARNYNTVLGSGYDLLGRRFIFQVQKAF